MSISAATSTSRQQWRLVMFIIAAGHITTSSPEGLLFHGCDIIPNQQIPSRKETIHCTLWNIQMAFSFLLCLAEMFENNHFKNQRPCSTNLLHVKRLFHILDQYSVFNQALHVRVACAIVKMCSTRSPRARGKRDSSVLPCQAVKDSTGGSRQIREVGETNSRAQGRIIWPRCTEWGVFSH